MQPYIILVNPQLAENVGMTARAMMNCGLYNLRLINPRENHLSEKAISASSNAEEILEKAVVFNSLEDAIADLNQVFATTARHRDMVKLVYTPDAAAIKVTEDIKKGIKYGIIFGPERTGLENDHVAISDAIIEIPLNPKHCSLNLSQAVLIVGYELYKLQNKQNNIKLLTNKSNVANKDAVINMLNFIEKELNGWANFKSEEKRPRMVRNLRNIFSRSQLTEQEVNTLYGIFNFFINKNKTRDGK